MSLDCFDNDLENNFENNEWNLSMGYSEYNNARNYEHNYLISSSFTITTA